MKKKRLAATSRLNLDRRFDELRPVIRFAPPIRGWIKAIREALGMTTAQLAKRLKMKQPSLVEIEQSEAKGAIQLRTLRRVAEALDCTLVYALVPNKPLETMVRDRARKIARRRMEPIEHSMRLEDQGLSTTDVEARIDTYMRDVDLSKLWDDK
jgi:predicted DNA-binding mobile mystery protein A